MRKTPIYILLSALSILFLAGCGKPKNIPEKKLEQITYEIMLANAYADMNSGMFRDDTLDMYTPILDKYGYNPADMRYTIQNYSKRKSTRYADVIEKAMQRLELESNTYKRLVSMRDSVDNLLAKRYRTEVYRRDSVTVYKKPSDPNVPDLSLDVAPGDYTISFRYFADTTLRSTSIQYRQYLENASNVKSAFLTRSYRRGEWFNEELKTTINDHLNSPIKTLNMTFASASIRTGERNIPFRVDIDSLIVWHYIPKEAVRDSFLNETFPQRNFDVFTKQHDVPKTVIPLRPDTARTDTPRSN